MPESAPTPPPQPKKISRPLTLRGMVAASPSPGTRRELQLLGRTLVTCILVGLVVGFAACLFHAGMEALRALLLDGAMHLYAPRPAGEAVIQIEHTGALRRWLVPIIPALGGLVSGLLVYHFAPEAAGGGGDAMIDAFHNRAGHIRGRVPVVKALASIIVLGSGGSAGREGPIMQIGAGFGSFMGKLLRTSERTRRLLLLAGTAAGMAAIFRTPLGAAIFAIEVLYRDDFEAEGIVPSIIAAVVAYSVFITVFGKGSHLFRTSESYPFSPASLPLYLLMAIALAFAGKLFVFIMHGSKERVWDRWKAPAWIKPAVGGLAMGCIAVVLPQVMGIGYGWLQDAVMWTGTFPIAWTTVLLLAGIALAKMVATSCTISSGGSGGDFGPSLVIGGLLGAAFGQAFHLLLPTLVMQPGAFALVGMATFFGGIAHVPLASLIMVCELTGSYDLLVPLMLSEGVAFALLRNTALYKSQVKSPLDSPAHAGELAVDILAMLRVSDAYDRAAQVKPVPMSMPLDALLGELAATRHATFPVADASGNLVGMVSLATLRTMLDEQEHVGIVVGDAMERLVTVAPNDVLSEALDRLLKSGHAELPVVEPGRPGVVGLIGHSEIVAAYNRELVRRRQSAS
jgi:CIC family chloride channel protein